MTGKRIKITLINKTCKEIDMSDVKVIPEDIFTGRKEIYTIEFPEGVEIIGNNAFEGCSSLVEVIFPDSIKKIESEAFLNCSNLKKVTIPEGVYVDATAFVGCALKK